MQTVLTSITHTGFSVVLLYGTFLLKYKERRLETIRNKTLRITFKFQRWKTAPCFTPFNFKLRVDTTKKHRIYNSTIKTAFLLRLDLCAKCIFPYYKQILNGSKNLKANINIRVIKK